jgi:hypothetical protein
MFSRLVEQTVESLSITEARNSPVVDVQSAESIVYVMVSTSASSPNTASIQLQGSLDQTSWVNVGSAVNVTTNAVHSVSEDRPKFRYYRVAYAIASGSYTSTLKCLAKG